MTAELEMGDRLLAMLDGAALDTDAIRWAVDRVATEREREVDAYGRGHRCAANWYAPQVQRLRKEVAAITVERDTYRAHFERIASAESVRGVEET